jgi:hypothetical protein
MALGALLRRHAMTCGFALTALSCGGVARISDDSAGSGGTRASSPASGGNAPAQAGGMASGGAGGGANGPLGCGVGADVPCLSIPPPEPPEPEPTPSCSEVVLELHLDSSDSGTGCGAMLPARLEGEHFDPRFLNLSYSDGNTLQTLVYVGTADACGTELGWYYDDATNPTEVFGCPRTCDFARSPSGYVSFTLRIGCPTKISR